MRGDAGKEMGNNEQTRGKEAEWRGEEEEEGEDIRERSGEERRGESEQCKIYKMPGRVSCRAVCAHAHSTGSVSCGGLQRARRPD